MAFKLNLVTCNNANALKHIKDLTKCTSPFKAIFPVNTCFNNFYIFLAKKISKKDDITYKNLK